MTHEERIRGALARRAVDCLPVVFGFSNDETKRLHAANFGMPFEAFCEYVGDNDIVQTCLAEDIQIYLTNPALSQYAFDLGYATADGTDNVVYDRWGVGWELSGGFGQRPLVHPLDTPQKIRDFHVPDVDAPGMFQHVERDLPRLKAQGFAVLVGQYYCLFEKAWVLMGYENFFVASHEHRDAVESLLDKLTDYRVAMAQRIVSYDVTCGHTGDDYGLQTGPVMSLDLWRTLFKPRLARIWKVYKDRGLPVIHHSCGDCRLYLDDMIEIGLDMLHPVQATAMPIDELQERYGSRLSFYGGIDCLDVVTRGTPRDVEANVRKTVEILGRQSGLVLGALNIMPDVPVANLRSLVDSMHKYKVLGGRR